MNVESSDEAKKRRKLIARLFKKYGSKCFYCPTPLDLEIATVDHYIPRAAGGSNHIDNLRPACFPCNNWKADRVPNADGTIPPKAARIRTNRSSRPVWCLECYGGRWIAPGARCETCYSGPMPAARPQAMKRKTWVCNHREFWCIACCLISEGDREILARKAEGMREEEAAAPPVADPVVA